MKIKDYEKTTDNFAIYPEAGTGSVLALSYVSLGVAGEAGEYADKIGKFIRDGQLNKPLALKELGDTLWFITRASVELGSSLEEIAEMNINKLADRQARGVLQGAGDVR